MCEREREREGERERERERERASARARERDVIRNQVHKHCHFIVHHNHGQSIAHRAREAKRIATSGEHTEPPNQSIIPTAERAFDSAVFITKNGAASQPERGDLF